MAKNPVFPKRRLEFVDKVADPLRSMDDGHPDFCPDLERLHWAADIQCGCLDSRPDRLISPSQLCQVDHALGHVLELSFDTGGVAADGIDVKRYYSCAFNS